MRVYHIYSSEGNYVISNKQTKREEERKEFQWYEIYKNRFHISSDLKKTSKLFDIRED